MTAIPPEQQEMVTRYISRNDFINAFVGKYADKTNMSTMWSRASNLWYRKEAIQKKIDKKKNDDRVVLVPARIHQKATPPDARVGRGDSLPDAEEILRRQNDILAELLQVTKESVELQKKQIGLFELLAEGRKQ